MILSLAKTNLELMFLYKTRTNKLVDKNLIGNAPKSWQEHLNYLFTHQGKSKFIYIAYEDNIMVGYCQYNKNIYEGTDIKLSIHPSYRGLGFSEQYNEVEVGFVIHPDHQGLGLGKKMVRELIELITKKDENSDITLWVKKDNIKAIKLYEDMGFVKMIYLDERFKMVLQ